MTLPERVKALLCYVLSIRHFHHQSSSSGWRRDPPVRGAGYEPSAAYLGRQSEEPRDLNCGNLWQAVAESGQEGLGPLLTTHSARKAPSAFL